MENSNSMWKLTALAGAVGLGLLGIMTFQGMMNRATPKTADAKTKLGIKDFRRPDEDKFGLSNEYESSEKPRSSRTAAKNSRKSDLVSDEDFDLGLDDPSSQPKPLSKKTTKSARSLAIESQEDDLSFEQSEPASRKRATPRIELSLDEPNEITDESEFRTTSASDPFDDSAPTVRSNSRANTKAQAQQLIQLARKFMDSGLFDEARQKANEAADLPVTFGALEDTPEAVLADLAKLESNEPNADSDRGIELTADTRREKKLSLDLDEPSFEEVPRRKSKQSLFDNDDNLFADNPPEAPKGVKREPDPPIPPAEDEKEGDLNLDLPSLPTTNKSRSRPESDDFPSKLKPLSTDRDSNDSVGVTGDGTVRPDAPRGPQRPELKIEKIAPPNASLGQPMIYTIVIRNVGESTAHQVNVEDQIPRGTSLSGTIPRAELSGKKLTWRIGAINPGESKEIQVKVVPVAEGQVGSVATVSFQAEVASRTNVASPQIKLRLNAPQQVRLGETAKLNFTISNNGSVDANQVVLRNMIPDNLKLEGVTERDLEYPIGTLAAGRSTTVELPLGAIRPGRATNKAIITVDGVSASEAQAEINVIGQLVGLNRIGPTSTFANKPVEFENRLTNNSLNSTANTTVVESLPNTVEFISATNGGKFDARQRTVTWHVPHLDPQESLSLKVRVSAKTTGNHLGSVQISEAGRKGTSTDYQFKAIGAANLSLEFVEKAEAYTKGEQFTVRMAVKNKGSGAATNVAIRLAVPNELQFVSMRGPVSHTNSGREIILEPIPEIGGQGTVTIDLTFRVIGSGDTKLQVELQSDQFRKPIAQEEPFVIFSN